MRDNSTNAGLPGRIAPAATCVVLLLFGYLAPGPAAAQTLAERYAALMRTAPEPELPDASRLRCVPPDPLGVFGGDPLRANNYREPLPDGQPLRAQQVPGFLQPTHNGSFGFNNVLVLGDHPAVTFERWDRDEDERSTRWRSETWRRTTTRAIAGRVVSVFRPRWPARLLRRALRYRSWGVDRPFLYWGRLLVPGTDGETNLFLRIVPPDISASPVARINDRVQYASHVVNLRVPDFGDSRVQGGDMELSLPEITRRFYEHFADAYEVIAVVSDAQQFSGNWGAFHRTVRNNISGIGLPLFDRSADFGSAGVLNGVEAYSGKGSGWASWDTVLHEQGHQYGERSKVWESLHPPLDRRWYSGHTPLLFPGAVTYGEVLYGDRRVTRVRSAGRPDRFEIERTLPLVRYHPLTLYRMGLAPASAVPDMLVFRDQGQFGGTKRPEPGTVVKGGTTAVTINDLLAADGVRRGPAVRRIRRAIVFVSRGRLVPKAQMNVLNYFARRLGASSGVTSWDRYPSFAEATRGRATMTTRIRPRGRPAARPGPAGRCAKVGTRALVGVRLDREVGGCLRAGDTLRVSGRLTLTDRRDYDTVCIRFRRYPDAGKRDRISECARLDGRNRFTLEATLPAGRPGGYRMQVYAFWPGSGRHLSSYTGAIEVLP